MKRGQHLAEIRATGQQRRIGKSAFGRRIGINMAGVSPDGTERERAPISLIIRRVEMRDKLVRPQARHIRLQTRGIKSERKFQDIRSGFFVPARARADAIPFQNAFRFHRYSQSQAGDKTGRHDCL